MTEEKKEVIDRLEYLLENLTEYGLTTAITEENQKDIRIALNLIQNQQSELEKKNKMIELIKEEIRNHIGFENRLKRDNREPDMFNQGRFYVANNINNILKGK